ncbi:hypothetical protein [Mycoplasma feriruminatoris]|uniref:hypothetical protein n=1 Tax=Mycoplasma feriruminatoris TaxID=1179777 RepID=UPI0002A4EF21|nr:hypothetical protein [Mycoplasma feriruminatoris]UKS54242.1 hypothetical protein D500_00596 [Mycoplasma feriruminatoris]WFQ96116.1 hypothetical protein MFERI15568_00550 [Mycoplasma feriruminatoris]VZK65414.1 hypothetical protein MF5292_00589 [Mycoplasma feriruminatoris]VZR98002.1 hypothetical protein MF5293_00586 [Mycoplasma feriruminatoris]
MESTKNNYYTEIEKLLALDYDSCVLYLLNKYGKVQGDYIKYSSSLFFKTIEENLDIKRSWYGLEIHHIDEDKIPNLSSKENREKYIREQKADRLVYCNLIEHLVLHIKIYEKTKNTLSKNGIRIIIRKINDYYSYHEFDDDRNKLFFQSIKDKKLDYFNCLAYINDKKILTGKKWFARSLLEDNHNNLYQLSVLYDEIDAYLDARILPNEVDDSFNRPKTFKLEKLEDLDYYVEQRKRRIQQEKQPIVYNKASTRSTRSTSSTEEPYNKPSFWSRHKWSIILVMFLVIFVIIFYMFIIFH